MRWKADARSARSTAPDSLAIWTQKIKGLTLHDTFTPKACAQVKAVPAITMGAGYRWGEVYDYVWARGLSVAGGSDANVGLIGWMTGGGHSPVSVKYGLGADTVLEMEVVTPSGELVTANACQNPDLFWATRGVCPLHFGLEVQAFRAGPSMLSHVYCRAAARPLASSPALPWPRRRTSQPRP